MLTHDQGTFLPKTDCAIPDDQDLHALTGTTTPTQRGHVQNTSSEDFQTTQSPEMIIKNVRENIANLPQSELGELVRRDPRIFSLPPALFSRRREVQ